MNYTPFISGGIIIGVMVLVYTWLFFQPRIMRSFHLADSRQFINDETTFNKLNSLMKNADVNLYSYNGIMDDMRYTLSISFKVGKNETASNRFQGNNFTTVINEAYDWSTQRGYLTLPNEKSN